MLWDIALELGESAVRLSTRENGLAFTAPALGAMQGDRLLAIGEDALDMLGRTPPGVRLVKPVEGGVIGEPRLAAQWIKRLLEPFTTGTKVIRPSVAFLDNGFFRQSERDLLVNAATELGAGQCGFISSDIAAAAGTGLDLRRPEGFALADIGAGTMSVCLIAFGRVVCVRRMSRGMDNINSDIVHLVRAQAGLAIGPRMAEELKLVLASALPAREVTSIAVGLDMKTGFPGEREISAAQLKPAVEPIVEALALATREIMQESPEELSADLLRSGLVLTGGGALLSGLDKALAERTGLSCHLPETPGLCTGKGMARVIQDNALSELAVRRA